MTQRWRPIGTSLTASPFRHRLHKRVLKPAIVVLAALASTGVVSSANAQPVNCDAYARSYANAHVNPDPADLNIYENGARGAVAGGIWDGPSGARRGAAIGGALSVLDNLGSYPAGWQSLYDLAYQRCANEQSGVTHRPTTLGDPNYYGRPLIRGQEPPAALEPRPELASPPPMPPAASPRR
jgi:hypothetical protein